MNSQVGIQGMYSFRQFEPRDIHNVISIQQSQDMNIMSHKMYLGDYAAWPDGFIVAEAGGKIVGFIMAGIVPTDICEEPTARIFLIVTHKDYVRQGIALMLLDILWDNARDIGITRIVTEIRLTNTRSIRFHLKHGFEIIQHVHSMYVNGDDGLILRICI